MATKSKPDPTIQTLVDGSQITVDATQFEDRDQEIKPQSSNTTAAGETSSDAEEPSIANENDTDHI